MSKQPYNALLAAEDLILDWTESLTSPQTRRCPVRLSERAHDALVRRIADLAAERDIAQGRAAVAVERVALLEGALRPFVKDNEAIYGRGDVNSQQWKAARAALEETPCPLR